MPSLILYTRPECHLCDEALERVREVAPDVEVRPVNIEDDLQLLRRYGLKVPVLRRTTDGAELAWPFNDRALEGFLESVSAG